MLKIKDREKELEKELKIIKIKNIILQNKNLPINEIKREVKKRFPDIDIDKLTEIIISNGVLGNDEKGKGDR